MDKGAPLAEKLRPQSLVDFVGQEHLVGEGKPLRVAVEKKHKFSFILWGPPGVGKTTIARIYARELGLSMVEMSAVSAGKRDLREEIEKRDGQIVLFLDEIHRFNKAQQDFLLPMVESSKVILVGATTENPSFEVISALLSRTRVFVLKQLERADFALLARKVEKKLGIKKIGAELVELATEMANGDARKFIGVFEAAWGLFGEISKETLLKAQESTYIRYDKKGDEHYDTISAFIKSMRASDADAAIYYLARMVEAGEDPKFIARRMVVFASEDVGMAQPTALVVANEVFRACETIGYPECAINLAHGVVYLASAKKDRRAYDALRAAQEDVRKHGNLPVPLRLRNAVTGLMKSEGYGEGYRMYDKESLLPEKLKGKRYYGDN